MTEAGTAAADPAMEVLSPAARPQQASQTTHRLIERIAAGPTGERLRMELVRRHSHLTRDEIDDAFQEALQRALVACRGEHEYEVYSFLRVTMRNCLSDRRYRVTRERSEENNGPTLGGAPDERPTPDVQLGRSEDRRELRELKSSVLRRLGDRQRRVFAMRVEGLDVQTIAAREAASQKAIRKDIEQIFAVGRDEILRRAGFGCADGHELVTRYAFRLRADWAAAQLHIAGCERCSRFFANVDSWRERAAAVLPFPAAGSAEPGAIAQALERAGDGLAHLRERVAGSPGSARQHVSEAAGAVKQHTAGALARMDPTPVAGARPGAATAAIVGCLAIGGGAATYCIQNDVNPINGLAAIVQDEPPKRVLEDRTQPEESMSDQRPIAPPAVVDSPPEPAPAPPEEPQEPPQAPPPPPPKPTPAAVQFGEPANPPPATQASAEPSPPTAAKPAPVPAEDGVDLYGP